MEITVLGKSPSWQDAGGACSGYLVEQDDYTLLLDCGSGVFSKLRSVRDYAAVEAVLISHLHADHFLDLVPFSYALIHGTHRSAGQPPPALHVPQGAAAVFRRVVGGWGDEALIETAFELHEYDAAELKAVCEPHFAGVEVLGMFGSPRYQALVDAERRELDRLLALDPLRLRRLVPRRARQRLYDRRLAKSRAIARPGAPEIRPDDFQLAAEPLAIAAGGFHQDVVGRTSL